MKLRGTLDCIWVDLSEEIFHFEIKGENYFVIIIDILLWKIYYKNVENSMKISSWLFFSCWKINSQNRC